MHPHINLSFPSGNVVIQRRHPKPWDAYITKWTTSGEPPVDLKSHWKPYFMSNKQKLSDHQYGRPCTLHFMQPIFNGFFQNIYILHMLYRYWGLTFDILNIFSKLCVTLWCSDNRVFGQQTPVYWLTTDTDGKTRPKVRKERRYTS